MASKLSVPDRALPTLQSLGGLPEDKHAALRKALEGTRVFDAPEALVQLFDDVLGFETEQSQALVAETFSMAHLLIEHGRTAETAASDISESQVLDLDEEHRALLQATLSTLLTSSPVIGLSTAAGVFTAHQRLFSSARVYVDMRPVFDIPREQTIGSVLTRKLQLGYYEDGEYRTIEIALQEAGYNELIKALESGRREASITEDMLRAAGSTVFKFDDSEKEEA